MIINLINYKKYSLDCCYLIKTFHKNVPTLLILKFEKNNNNSSSQKREIKV